MSAQSGWYLRVLGTANLTSPAGDTLTLDRKTAGVLTYLAVSGATTRSRLAGLLWPDTPERTSRNNLVQLLRKLRLATGHELVPGKQVVRLAEFVQVDALVHQELFLLGQFEEYLGGDRRLLAQFDYDDCPEFEEWLITERERYATNRGQALQALMDRSEAQGDLAGALRWADLALQEDPASENVFVRIMRLQYLQGQRHKALETFQRCRDVLRDEFGVEPLTETLTLARTIQASGEVPALTARAPAAVPVSVRRPPVLIGRDEEWQRLERAWEEHPVTFLAGAPGAGKTRLALDFAGARGEGLHLEIRPGDERVPYSASTRHARQMLQHLSNVAPPLSLPEWVRRELSRLVPELMEGEPPSLSSAAEKVRFFDAYLLLWQAVSRTVPVAVIDDWQFADPASSELLLYLWSDTCAAEGEGSSTVRVLCTYRAQELPEAAQQAAQRLIDSGRATRIDVPPLTEHAVQALLDSLALPAFQGLAGDLARHTRGNPLFVLETLKVLLESGHVPGSAAERLPVPKRVEALIERRLQQLTPEARQVAQAAAALQTNFSIDLVAEVLNASLLSLMPTWTELERLQILTGNAFDHDVIYEVVRSSASPAVWHALHRNAARALERHQADPARIAGHWMEGQQPAHAVPFLLKAAQSAKERFLMREAATFAEQAASVLEALAEREAALAALNTAGHMLTDLEDVEGLNRTVQRMAALARSPSEKATTLILETYYWYHLGEIAQLDSTARKGLRWAVQAGDQLAEAAFQESIATAAILSGDLPGSQPALERILDIGQHLNDPEWLGKAHQGLGMVHAARDHHAAIKHFSQAQQVYQDLNDYGGLLATASKLSRLQLELGDAQAALHTLQEADAYLELLPQGYQTTKLIHWWWHSLCQQALGHYGTALAVIDQALNDPSVISTGLSVGWTEVLRYQRAAVLSDLAQYDEAITSMRTALASPSFVPTIRGRVLHSLGKALLAVGQTSEAAAFLEEAQARLKSDPESHLHLLVALTCTDLLPAQARLPAIGRVEAVANRRGYRGLALACQVQRARLGAGPLNWTWPDAEADLPLCGAVSTGEVLVVLQTSGVAGAAQLADRWLKHTAHHHVPTALRDVFLQRHPVALAIRQAEQH